MSNGVDDVIDLSASSWPDADMNGAPASWWWDGLGERQQAKIVRLLGNPRFDALLAEVSAGSSAELAALAEEGAAIELAMAQRDQEAIELANVGKPLEARQAHDRNRAFARQAARQLAQQGDILAAAKIHIDLSADPYGPSASAIELAGTGDDLGLASNFAAAACGGADSYGRCSARYHELSCSATIEGAAATGSAEDARFWRDVLQGHADTGIEADPSVTIRDSVLAAGGLIDGPPKRAMYSDDISDPSAPRTAHPPVPAASARRSPPRPRSCSPTRTGTRPAGVPSWAART